MHDHQQKQIAVIDSLEKQVQQNTVTFTTVTPVDDFELDPRICLTSVHLPSKELKNRVQQEIIEPLLPFSQNCYVYSDDNLHMTIKNVRVINDPPHFTEVDISRAEEVFSKVVPKHRTFKVYFYRLLLFPNNLALIGTTDPELDALVIDLDQHLKRAGIPDDKVYANSHYFFSNMTLLRFAEPIHKEFRIKIQELSEKIQFKPYLVDTVTLLTANAVLKAKKEIGTWKLV